MGALIKAPAAFDRLRIDNDILRLIPLEGVANTLRRDKLVTACDAAKLVPRRNRLTTSAWGVRCRPCALSR